MRVVLLGNVGSIHIVKWANGLSQRGHDVHVATQDELGPHGLSDEVQVHRFPYRGQLGYFRNGRALRKLADELSPDVVNAHYASGYGTTMRLARLKVPTVLNVWGSDVFDFPKVSPIHALLIKGNLRSATRIASTSHCMADEVRKLLGPTQIDITPFGTDMQTFTPLEGVRQPTGIIGTIKWLDSKYGIDTLIQAFAKLSGTPKLVIAGEGPDREALEALASELGVRNRVEFLGRIPNAEVPALLRQLDVYVALSRLDSESFGVAIVEASACGCPVVVSDAAGPAEVVEDGVTGYVVPKEDVESAAIAIQRLLDEPDLAQRIGHSGRQVVLERYSSEICLRIMEETYIKALESA